MAKIIRIFDVVLCTCSCRGASPCPHGVVITSSENTYVEGFLVARVGDLTSNCCGACCRCPNTIITGQPRTFVNGRNIAVDYSRVTCGIPISSTNFTFTS